MINIKRLLYSLKRRFGTCMDFYRETDTVTNIETGLTTFNHCKFHIDDGIFLDQREGVRNPVNKILDQFAGMMDTYDVAILIDGNDFCDNYIPELNDYVIIENQRYEIQNIQEVDENESYFITLTEYVGSEIYEIHDVCINDKLTLFQIGQGVLTTVFDATFYDILTFTEQYTTDYMVFSGLEYNFSILDNLNLTQNLSASTDMLDTESMVQSFIFTDQVSINKIHNYSISDEINFSQTSAVSESSPTGISNSGYITQEGLIAVFAKNGINYTPFTVVTTSPTFYLNGSSTPLAVYGPFYANSAHNLPAVFYLPATPFLVTDSLKMTAPASWATTATGLTPAANLLTLQNSLGQPEPSMGSYSNVPVPGFNQPSSQWVMPVAAQVTAHGKPCYFSTHFPLANALLRSGTPSHVLTQDSNGHPLTISAAATLQPILPNSGGPGDGRLTPQATGIYTWEYDEKNPSNPMPVTLGSGQANVVVTPLGISGLVNPGTLIGGVLVGRKYQWNVTYISNTATNFYMNLMLTISKPTSASYPCPWTMTNEFFGDPSNQSRPTNPMQISANFAKWLTTPSGKTPTFIRWMQTGDCGSTGSVGSCVDPQDLSLDTNWVWGNQPAYQFNISSIDAYDPSVSPDTWWSQPWPNATTPGGGPTGLPYMLPSGYTTGPTGPATGWGVGRVVLSSPPYQLKSGQQILFANTSALTAIPCTNGNQANITVNLANYSPFIEVDQAGSFLFWFPHGFTNTTGQPGGINNVAGNNTITGGTLSLQIPISFALPYKAQCAITAQLPNTDYWANYPMAGTDATYAAIATKIFNTFPSVRLDGKQSTVYSEWSNENWNTAYPYWAFGFTNALGSLKAISNTFTANYEVAVLRAWQMHNIVQATANSMGWTGKLVRVFGSQQANPAETQVRINFINTYNTANPGNPIQVDAIAIAPYVPTGQISDSTLQQAAASIWNLNATPYQLTRGQWWDIFKHHTRLNTTDNGPTGIIAQQLNYIKQYIPVNDQPADFIPELIMYEGGLQNAIPVSTSGNSNTDNQISSDLIFDKTQKNWELGCYGSWQAQGYAKAMVFTLSDIRAPGNPGNFWPQTYFDCQPFGPGDGTGPNLITNTFQQNTGLGQDITNESVRLYSMNLWNDSVPVM